jgi:hypothetical protein
MVYGTTALNEAVGKVNIAPNKQQKTIQNNKNIRIKNHGVHGGTRSF